VKARIVQLYIYKYRGTSIFRAKLGIIGDNGVLL
jgi:hypothetical protein